jgi:hypothetical protein
VDGGNRVPKEREVNRRRKVCEWDVSDTGRDVFIVTDKTRTRRGGRFMCVSVQ